jgi:hypothetical protein
MYYYRVTKYNPESRNERGWYLRDEWTDFSCVGITFNGQIFTMKEYERFEDLYINAVLQFMYCIGIKKLVCSYCWKPKGGFQDEPIPSSWKKVYLRVRKRSSVEGGEIVILLKMILRNYLVCKLEYKDKFFVHFGYDYYMYIGVEKECKIAKEKIRESGLFVEDFVSPYLHSDEDD